MQNINVNKLKGKMVERGYSVEELAKQMGLSTSTLYRKIQESGETMLIKDANNIVRLLDLDEQEAVAIFFNQLVA